MTQAQHLSGEYHLTGVPEMAAGFNFMPDGNFGFFYIYGAVDRMAMGTYTVEGNTVHLHSDKEPGKDFDIKTQSKKGKGYTIRIVNDNEILASNVRCIYFINGTQQETFADEKGVITIEAPECDKIYVQHALFPDIATLVKDEGNNNNYFELTLNPELQKVSFKGIDLTIDGDVLTCLPNYFMPMSNIRFVKD